MADLDTGGTNDSPSADNDSSGLSFRARQKSLTAGGRALSPTSFSAFSMSANWSAAAFEERV